MKKVIKAKKVDVEGKTWYIVDKPFVIKVEVCKNYNKKKEHWSYKLHKFEEINEKLEKIRKYKTIHLLNIDYVSYKGRFIKYDEDIVEQIKLIDKMSIFDIEYDYEYEYDSIEDNDIYNEICNE